MALPSETGQQLADQQEFLRQQGIELYPPFSLKEHSRILTPEALEFVASLERRFGPKIEILLTMREGDQAKIDKGAFPDFLSGTKEKREGDWTVNATIPKDLQDRRVEITGPVDRRMMINALNSGANVFMADFEDSLSPTGENVIQGQENLLDAVRGTITFDTPKKHYELNEQTATLMVRPRGLHLTDKHVFIDGKPVSAALLDFGLYFFHNARALIDRGSGPYFYLPKLQNHLEARLWNDVFVEAQKQLDIPNGTIRATVLIEHILAAFQTHEILWELQDHSAGLNCGRWDYLFSLIKTFRNHPKFVLPDRAQVTMETEFMKAYAQLVIDTCHRRGVHAMGGMSAYIPVEDPDANTIAFDSVRKDKIREATMGHDGTWVAHPGLIAIAKEVFDQNMPLANQIETPRREIHVTAADLLRIPKGTITEAGLRTNIAVGLRYIYSWLSGNGAANINNLMEDAATAEISRSQLWQWIHHGAIMKDGRVVDDKLFTDIFTDEFSKLWDNLKEGDKATLGRAGQLLAQAVMADECPDFLTIQAYEHLP